MHARWTSVVIWFASVALLPTGCTGDDEPSNGEDESCIEGRVVSCPCSGETTGIQTCRADGTWGACDCSGGSGGDVSPGLDVGDVDSADSSNGDGRVDPPDDGGTDAAEDVGTDGTGKDATDSDSPNPLRSVRGTSRFEEDVELPECEPSNDDVQIIDENSDWSTIDGEARIYCVRPGDYTGAGDLEVTASGSEGARRYLVYDGPTDAHPVDRPGDEQAVVQRLHFDGASYWTVVGLEVADDVGREITGAIEVSEGSDHNVFDRLVIGPDEEEWVDHPLYETYGNHNTLQNSVVGDTLNWGVCAPVKAPGRDRVVRGNKIVSNEMFNCLDHVQLVVTVPDHSGTSMPGTIVAHNDMYFDDDYSTDGNGNFDPEGGWNCGENGVDIKAGGEGDDPARIVGNRIWGMSNKDQDCQGAGSTPPSGAGAIIVHEGQDDPTVGVRIENNIVFDSPKGISVGHADEVRIEGNLVHTTGAIDGHEAWAFVALDAASLDLRSNTVVDSEPHWANFWDGVSGSFENNVVVRGGADNSGDHGLTTSRNAYYGATPLENDPWIDESEASASGNDEFCVTLQGYTNPREKCFEFAASTENSPHGADVGFRSP